MITYILIIHLTSSVSICSVERVKLLTGSARLTWKERSRVELRLRGSAHPWQHKPKDALTAIDRAKNKADHSGARSPALFTCVKAGNSSCHVLDEWWLQGEAHRLIVPCQRNKKINQGILVPFFDSFP